MHTSLVHLKKSIVILLFFPFLFGCGFLHKHNKPEGNANSELVKQMNKTGPIQAFPPRDTTIKQNGPFPRPRYKQQRQRKNFNKPKNQNLCFVQD